MAYGSKIQALLKAARVGGGSADGGAGLARAPGQAAANDTVPAAPQRMRRAGFTQRHLELPSDTAERARLEQGGSCEAAEILAPAGKSARPRTATRTGQNGGGIAFEAPKLDLKGILPWHTMMKWT